MSGQVVEHAIRNDGKMFREVQRRGDYEEGEKKEKDRVCYTKLVFVACESKRGYLHCGSAGKGQKPRCNILKINFSVDVNM